ncbi:MAG: TetR/AcrR family transcriptional regulator [Chloroflexota bacterium]
MKQPEDRRVRRTKERLRNGLLQLLLEKPYKDISVQNILDVADVSRAAFYAHYQDKDTLMLSGLPDNVLHYDTWEESDELLPPVTALFQHVSGGQEWLAAMQGTAVMQMINLKARQRMVENWLTHFARLQGTPNALKTDPEPVAFYLTGALMSLLAWWSSNGMPKTAEEMNILFQRLARNGLINLEG